VNLINREEKYSDEEKNFVDKALEKRKYHPINILNKCIFLHSEGMASIMVHV
jgi:hypothetical protein